MARNEEPVRRLVTIPGIGAINATALVAAVGQRQGLSAWTGHGGVTRIDPPPDDDQRQAAPARHYLVEQKTPLGRWACGLLARAHKNVVVVALKLGAHRLVVLARGGVYNAGYEAVAA
jgi:transposase